MTDFLLSLGSWDLFWIFWIIVVPVALLVWMTVWIVRRYDEDVEQREELLRKLKAKEREVARFKRQKEKEAAAKRSKSNANIRK